MSTPSTQQKTAKIPNAYSQRRGYAQFDSKVMGAPNLFEKQRQVATRSPDLVKEEQISDEETTPSDLSEIPSSTEIQLNPTVEHVAKFLTLARGSPAHVRSQVNFDNARKRRKGKGTDGMSGFSAGVIPDRMRTVLKWVYQQGNTTGTPPIYLNLQPSNLLDIGLASSVRQPLGYDQWTQFYNKYVVTKSRTKFMVSGRGQTGIAFSACYNTTLVGASGGWDRVAAQPRAWTGQAAIEGPSLDINTGWVDHAAVYGVTGEELRSIEDFFGTSSTAPTDNLSLDVCLVGAGTFAYAATFNYSLDIIIELEVEWFDRVILNSS